MKPVLAWAALASLAAGLHLQAHAAEKPDTAKARQIATETCAACHGADGNSAIPANPTLAGQHAEYIAKQLMNFKSGDRKNPVMNGMAAPLSPEDIKGLGAYYAEQKPKPGSAKNKELVVQGEKIYRGGNFAKGIPACSACHSPDGAGIPAQYPRVAGQHADYTLAQLIGFRNGERANDPSGMMRAIVSKMSEAEMKAVAEYISGLR